MRKWGLIRVKKKQSIWGKGGPKKAGPVKGSFPSLEKTKVASPTRLWGVKFVVGLGGWLRPERETVSRVRGGLQYGIPGKEKMR